MLSEFINSDDLSPRDQRSLILHLLYAADAYNYETSLESIADNISKGFEIDIPTNGKVFLEAKEIIQEREALDQRINSLLANWRFERLGTTTRLILRFGLWELLFSQTEPIIVINEAIELAKCFAEKDAYKFVNGILDEFIKKDKDKPA